MRILVHDYSGHPFQVELSRELSRRGHEVTHSYCEAHQSGKGHLTAEPGEQIRFDPIACGDQLDKGRFVRRLFKELGYGVQLMKQIRRIRPDVVMIGNAPIPTMTLAVAALMLLRTPWTFWQQDVQAVAARSFAGRQLSSAFRAVAAGMDVAERWCARRAAAIVVIADSFLDVHRRWGTHAKTTVIPNWAPLNEIYPVDRKNDWAVEQHLDDTRTLLYSGTLGLKHNPALLVRLARAVIDHGQPVRLAVVNEGPAGEILRREAGRLGVPLTLLPFQPYERLPEVLGTGDVLVVVLEHGAGAFSVPSKTLSYLCAGRPVLGLMPGENLAAHLIAKAHGKVVSPCEESLQPAAEWVCGVLTDQAQATAIGDRSRALAEAEFALDGCADKFERILAEAAGVEVAARKRGHDVPARDKALPDPVLKPLPEAARDRGLTTA